MFTAASIRLTVKRFPAAPALAESAHHYEHAYLQFDVVVIGGGQRGLEAALASASRGMQVALLEKEPPLGGYDGTCARSPGPSDDHNLSELQLFWFV